jgi:preprotein translocase subunit SecD
MSRDLVWRGVLILGLLVGAVVASVPPEERINLGLDLRGGMHLVLEVQVEDAVRAEVERNMQLLAEELGLSAAATQRTGDTSFAATGLAAVDRQRIEEVVDSRLGRQLWGWRDQGDRVVFDLTAAEAANIRDQAVEQALQTIRNRIDQYGVAEPVIQRVGLGGDRILVQLPGVDDPERIRGLIKSTAFLEFRLVDFPLGGASAGSRQEILAHYGGRLPEHLEIGEEVVRNERGEEVSRRFYALEKRQVITGRDLKSAQPSLGQFNEPVVQFTLAAEAANRFAEVTANNVGRGLAIVLDKRVVSAPNIKSRISDRGQIEGRFTAQEVQDLSLTLRSGALPAGITYLEERTVGPALGRDSIEQGLRAGWIGAVLVVLTMLVVYRFTGINAVVALGLNVILIFAVLAMFGATLTLPGIAGIILTVGMAVDANVLIFERIKEELRVGRTVKSAVDAGFGKALSSILDGNITTLIAALFLFQFGTGPIKGFAVTLSVGILASLFSAIFVSRFLFDLYLSRRQRVERLSI